LLNRHQIIQFTAGLYTNPAAMKRPYRWWICLNSKLKTQHLKLAYSAFGAFADKSAKTTSYEQ